MVGKILALLTLPGLPRFWQAAIYALAGIAVGMAVVVVSISNTVSYLSDSPETYITETPAYPDISTRQKASDVAQAFVNNTPIPLIEQE